MSTSIIKLIKLDSNGIPYIEAKDIKDLSVYKKVMARGIEIRI